MTQLTEHFSLAELIASDTAMARGIDNTPNAAQLLELQRLAKKLEVMRERLGKPLKITSGLRVKKLNTAVKGASMSQHLHGRAADISVAGHDRHEMIVAALSAGFTGIGLGRSFLHVDTRPQSGVTVWKYQGGATAMWVPALGANPLAKVREMAKQ